MHILGSLPPRDIADLYLAADLFVFPSTLETFGIAAVEAAMVGMPMVVADLPALREVLRAEGEEPVAFAAPHDVEAWIAAISAALAAPPLPQIAAIFARTIRRRYSRQRMIENYLNLFRERHAAVKANGGARAWRRPRRSPAMTRWMRLAALLVVAGVIGPAAGAAEAVPPAFKRGATLVEFFEFPATVGDGLAKSYAVPAYPHALSALASLDFDTLRRIGSDRMRVPLDLGPLMQGGQSERRQTIEDVVAVVSAINSHGLNVLVTLFPPSLQHELPQTYLDGLEGPKFRAYSAMVERVAAALAPVDKGGVALEAMNEPQSPCRIRFGTHWTAYQQNLVERIRRIAPQLPLFLTGGCWSNIEGIVLLDSDLLRDRRNFVSVHFYYPFLFTHQSAPWTLPYLAGTIGVPFPRQPELSTIRWS